MSGHEAGLVAKGFPVPTSMPALPPARDFLTSAGFGGAATLAAAIIVALIAFFAARRASKRHEVQLEQQERHHREMRDDEQRATAITRCWQRLVWVVETAGIEPAASENATLGLGPELALELLRGLLRDAEQLGDDTLAKSVTVYLNQFSLVLAQQSGSLSSLGTDSVASSAVEANTDVPPTQQAPRQEAPTQGSPRQEAPTQGSPRQEAPTQGSPKQGAPKPAPPPAPGEPAATTRDEPSGSAVRARRRHG